MCYSVGWFLSRNSKAFELFIKGDVMFVAIFLFVFVGIVLVKANNFMANDRNVAAAAWLVACTVFLISLYNIVN